MAAEQNPRIAIAAIGDQVVIVSGRRYDAAIARDEAPPTRRKPWARMALVRALARTSRPRRQSELALETGATQAAVSQGLKQIESLVERRGGGWALKDIRPTIDYFLAHYPGPHGITQYWYGVQPVIQQAERVATLSPTALLSGDAGADRIAPWRTPRMAIIYVDQGLDLAPLGFAEATPDRATVSVTVPSDPTIWHVATAYAGGRRAASVVDPLLCAYDVARSGGSDADEARERILEALTKSWTAGRD
ncbi:hypothetical protein [Homoserinibacter sp. GY 40078]|uniref:hypothetical protein n=1 Tax=Homoserinibacter sp. GY 40078 TaxID=2603275 RepID=UPI0011CCC840|nr:hypothetical protein [Homoserinibacter sp. GY 40078]TXK19107.1 hypothetical protein FVQ89_04075 [Homoserinibacter sp. GY 40078]